MKFVCTVCKIEKFEDEFHLEPRTKKGRAGCCRMCIKEIRKGRHKKRSSSVEPPEKARARKAVKDAVRRGQLIKPSACEVCGKLLPKHQLQGHHDDYTKPLSVIWLCASCHGVEHMSESALRAELRRLRSQERSAA